MTGPVNIIKFKFDSNATLERHWRVVIDKIELVDAIERAVETPVAGHWPSKSKALLNLDELKETLTAGGQWQLLICANCAASGYKSCGDLDLGHFTVRLEDEFVLWEVKPPHPATVQQMKLVRYRFHRPQYEGEVRKVVDGRRSA